VASRQTLRGAAVMRATCGIKCRRESLTVLELP
jgi:hypothetical protein